MRTLTAEQVNFIHENYLPDAAEGMLNPENADKVLAFIERASEGGITLTYPQAFWANKGVAIYEKDGEKRMFSDSTLAGLAPLTAEDSDGDWQEWLEHAKLVKRVEGWK